MVGPNSIAIATVNDNCNDYCGRFQKNFNLKALGQKDKKKRKIKL